jgi:hypothetical protein
VSGPCHQYLSSRLSQNLVPCVGVLQMVVGHSRWRRPIRWCGPFDRSAWVSAGAASSKKLRPSDSKEESANFVLTEFQEVGYQGGSEPSGMVASFSDLRAVVFFIRNLHVPS